MWKQRETYSQPKTFVGLPPAPVASARALWSVCYNNLTSPNAWTHPHGTAGGTHFPRLTQCQKPSLSDAAAVSNPTVLLQNSFFGPHIFGRACRPQVRPDPRFCKNQTNTQKPYFCLILSFRKYNATFNISSLFICSVFPTWHLQLMFLWAVMFLTEKEFNRTYGHLWQPWAPFLL